MNNITNNKIIENLRNNKFIPSKDWNILISFILKRMGINSSKIDIHIVSASDMKKKRNFPRNYIGGSILKSEDPSLKKDEIWINNKLSAGQIVRVFGHELGHIVTKEGSVKKFGRLIAESSAFSIDKRFVKIFNELYNTHVTEKDPCHGSNKKEKEIYCSAWEKSFSIIPVIKKEYKNFDY